MAISRRDFVKLAGTTAVGVGAALSGAGSIDKALAQASLIVIVQELGQQSLKSLI